MHVKISLLLVFLCLTFTANAQTPIVVQEIKELKPTGSLSTCGYKPVDAEKTFFEKLPPNEQATGSFMEAYDIHKKEHKYVSWFGIVRGISKSGDGGDTQLLLEHKYFDGMTDCHIMLVSMSGSGDFHANLQATADSIPALALVRVYGTVTTEKDGTPVIKADFIRVWPWMTFTFTDLGGADKTNEKWKKECKICGGRIYKPYPDQNYYRRALGDPSQFGIALK